jgi:hypothetical protein
MSPYTILGLAGVACIVVAYFLLQTRRSQADSPRYLWLNLVGSVLIALSLIPEWNLPSFVIEVFWIAITLYGFWRAWATRKKSRDFNGAGEGVKKSAGDINFSLAPKPEQD